MNTDTSPDHGEHQHDPPAAMDHSRHNRPSAGQDRGGHDMHAPEREAPGGAHDHASMMADPRMAAQMERDMRNRFLVSFLLTIPVILYSDIGEAIFGSMPPAPFGLSMEWMGFILCTPVVVYGGWVFIVGTWNALKNRRLDMSVLITTGVAAAYLFSVGVTFTGGGEVFYEAAAMLITFVLFGHWMEMKSRRGTTDALRALLTLVPEMAVVVRDGQEVAVPTSEVVPGDRIRVRAGQRVPVDGEIVEGQSALDESLVTGESLPVERAAGDAVVAGSVNGDGSLLVRAVGTGSDTVLGRIIDLVQNAQASKAPAQRIADRAAAILVVVAVGSGIITFLAWTFLSDAEAITAMTFAISAVVIACPDALGLATPTAVAVGTGLGARHKILIKDAATLERVSAVNAIVLDKTGTITEGKPEVVAIVPGAGVAESVLLENAAALEAASTHPLAVAIVRAAHARGLHELPLFTDAENVPGYGTKGLVGGRTILAGNPALLAREGIPLAPDFEDRVAALATGGRTVVTIAIGGELAGMIALADVVRPSSARTIAALKHDGIEVALLTGDNRATAEAVGKVVGVDRIFAEVKPEQKADYIRQLQREGKVVAMVGDGVNDAPALAAADVGIAIGAGTDVAIETASVVLMRSDPVDIVKAIELSKATMRKMKQNLFWASIYNVLAIPLAAGILYSSTGFQIRPEIAALLMSVSSIIVATNAVLLRREGSKLEEVDTLIGRPATRPLPA
ncbi:MAG: copper-translocating P-type ATPase [Dehalococcoidia bacterium]